ncbi:MAG TPA: FAD-binding oxidoreductase [Solirubrobacteraceae bacterium]|nr:FAD-binding oxidoreductase [Solirubrobacteraceae bacterium]
MTATVVDGFTGELLRADDPDYEARREVWNLLHDRRPALIARCGSPADVAAALAYGRERGLPIAIRCGGHSLPGHSTVDGGLVIDLRPLNRIEVDPAERIVRVQGGALLGDVDREAQAYGLVVPVGVVSHTGVGGLTLGGGVGRLMRRFGLTIDSLLEAEVVLVDGRVVRASSERLPELFWGLRGGGGNFGVVSEFVFRAQPLTELVVLGCFQPLERARAVLALAERVMSDPATPRELLWTSFLRKPPPGAPFVPRGLGRRPGIMSLIEWSGEPGAGHALLARIRDQLDAPGASIDRVPYLRMQTLTDELLAPGTLRAYVKAGFTDRLTAALADVLGTRAQRIGSDMSVIELLAMGGAISDTPADATAFAHRDARWLINVPAQWRAPAETEREIGWCRETFDAIAPHLSGGAYSNFMEGDEGDAAATAYGALQERLAAIKDDYDPANVLRLNQNIRPAVRP